MANPNPVKKTRFSDIKNPKLRTMDVLKWCVDNHPDEVTSRMVADRFGLELSEGGSRLLSLYKWDFLRILEKGGGRTFKVYYVNENGFQKVESLMDEGYYDSYKY